VISTCAFIINSAKKEYLRLTSVCLFVCITNSRQNYRLDLYESFTGAVASDKQVCRHYILEASPQRESAISVLLLSLRQERRCNVNIIFLQSRKVSPRRIWPGSDMGNGKELGEMLEHCRLTTRHDATLYQEKNNKCHRLKPAKLCVSL